jgi:hypothetical protein
MLFLFPTPVSNFWRRRTHARGIDHRVARAVANSLVFDPVAHAIRNKLQDTTHPALPDRFGTFLLHRSCLDTESSSLSQFPD